MGGARGRCPQDPPPPRKKSRKSRIFLFDLRKSPPYNPRPRCFAAKGFDVVLPLICDVKFVERALFDIVIIGRGTWAAARYATTSKLKL